VPRDIRQIDRKDREVTRHLVELFVKELELAIDAWTTRRIPFHVERGIDPEFARLADVEPRPEPPETEWGYQGMNLWLFSLIDQAENLREEEDKNFTPDEWEELDFAVHDLQKVGLDAKEGELKNKLKANLSQWKILLRKMARTDKSLNPKARKKPMTKRSTSRKTGRSNRRTINNPSGPTYPGNLPQDEIIDLAGLTFMGHGWMYDKEDRPGYPFVNQYEVATRYIISVWPIEEDGVLWWQYDLTDDEAISAGTAGPVFYMSEEQGDGPFSSQRAALRHAKKKLKEIRDYANLQGWDFISYEDVSGVFGSGERPRPGASATERIEWAYANPAKRQTAAGLIKQAEHLWAIYDKKPTKANLMAFGAQLGKMKHSKSVKVKEDRRQGMRAFNAEMKARGWKMPKKNPCLGLHFHGKDAEALLKAAQKVQKNPRRSKRTRKATPKRPTRRPRKNPAYTVGREATLRDLVHRDQVGDWQVMGAADVTTEAELRYIDRNKVSPEQGAIYELKVSGEIKGGGRETYTAEVWSWGFHPRTLVGEARFPDGPYGSAEFSEVIDWATDVVLSDMDAREMSVANPRRSKRTRKATPKRPTRRKRNPRSGDPYFQQKLLLNTAGIPSSQISTGSDYIRVDSESGWVRFHEASPGRWRWERYVNDEVVAQSTGDSTFSMAYVNAILEAK
jgi:hypothetical protein